MGGIYTCPFGRLERVVSLEKMFEGNNGDARVEVEGPGHEQENGGRITQSNIEGDVPLYSTNTAT